MSTLQKFLLITFLSILSINLHAQFSYGVKGGLTLSNVNLNIPERFSHSFRLGGHIAIFATIGGLESYSTTISFQPELSFIQKGVTVNDDQTDKYLHVRLNYLEMPLLIKTTINLKMLPNIYFAFGPFVSVLLGDRYKTKELSNSEIDLRNGLLDAGYILSLGTEIKKFIIEFRLSGGLINIAEKTDEEYYDSRNNYANFSIGYIIR